MSIWIRKKQARKKAAQETGRRTKQRKRPVLEALSLPEDVSEGCARVILLGERRALIENLLGVADVGQEEIRLTTRDGVLTVRGRALKLTDVQQGALAVTGRIDSIGLPPSGEEAGGHD